MYWLTVFALAALVTGGGLVAYGVKREGNINKGTSGVPAAILGALVFAVGAVALLVDAAIRIWS